MYAFVVVAIAPAMLPRNAFATLNPIGAMSKAFAVLHRYLCALFAAALALCVFTQRCEFLNAVQLGATKATHKHKRLFSRSFPPSFAFMLPLLFLTSVRNWHWLILFARFAAGKIC